MSEKKKVANPVKVAYEFYKNEKYDNALKLLLKVEKEKKRSKKIILNSLYLMGDIFLDLRKFKKALEIYSKILKFQKSDIAYSNQGLAYWELKKYELALRCYLRAIKINSSNPMALRGAGEMYLKLNMPLKAVGYLTKATRLRPGYVDAITCLGIAYFNLNDFVSASRLFRKSLSLDGSDHLAKKGLKLIYKKFNIN